MQSSTQARTVLLPPSVRSALRLFFALTGLCLVTELFCHFVLHLHHPYDWPFPPHENRFSDFLVYDERLRLFHSPDFFTKRVVPPFSYPPAAATVLSLFYLSSRPLVCFLATMFLCILGAAVLFGRVLLKHGLSIGSAAATVLLFAISYPLVLDVQQGNCEWILWLVLMVGLCAFLADRPALAAVFLGLGAAIKLYPIILLALFIPRRQYRWLAAGLVTFLVSSLGSMWLESGSIALSWAGTIRGLTGLDKGFILHPMDFWDHSLFEFFKGAQALGHPEFLSQAASLKLQRFYLLVMAAIGIVLFLTRIRKMPVINQILALVTASVLLPPISMDYTLIHLFLPCGLLILGELRNAKSGVVSNPTGVRAALLTFACLFAPMTELTLYGHTLSNTVRTIALIALFVISLRYPLEATESLQQREPSKIEAALAA